MAKLKGLMGCSIELARRRPVGALVIESAFASIPELGQELYRWLPVRWLARIRYDNAQKIPALDTAILVIHSPDDDIVPFAHGRLLFERLGRPERWSYPLGHVPLFVLLPWRDGRVVKWIERSIPALARD